MSETWIVVPTYDEAANLEPLVRGLGEALRRVEHRILVVDDASPDGTGDVADRLAAELPSVQVLHRGAKRGLGRAYVAGLGRALEGGAARVVTMDADLSHDPVAVPRLLEAVATGADLALGSRYVAGGRIEGWGPGRRAVSRAGCWYARTALGVGIRDLTGGFKCFRADALRALAPETAAAHGYAFQVEMTHRALAAGMRVVEVPVTFREREHGRSKMTPRIAMEAAWRVPLLRLRPTAMPERAPTA